MAAVPIGRMRSAARARVGSTTAWRTLVGIGALVFASAWSGIAVQRWRDLQTGAFDFAFFEQIIWNTAHGRWFATSFVPYNFLGQHVEPVLLVFAGTTRLGAGPLSLLVVQALVCALAAPVLFEAARALGLRAEVAGACALGYLASPYLHRALIFDFHPETMVALPAFAAAWALATGRRKTAVACALACLLFKEDAAFVALALATWAWWRGERGVASVIAGITLAWTAFAVGWWMPHLREGVSGDLVERYAAFTGGQDGLAALVQLARHPVAPLRALSSSPSVATAATFILAAGPAMLAAPLAMLWLVPGLALALLSSHAPQAGLQLHYAVEIVPLVSLATVLGARRLSRRVPAPLLATGIGGAALLAAIALSPLSPLHASGGDAPSAAHRAAVAAAVAVVPPGEAVSAQSNLASRLARRTQLWEFPGHWQEAQWVVVDRYGFRSSQSLASGYDAVLARVRSSWTPTFEQDGVTVYRAPRR